MTYNYCTLFDSYYMNRGLAMHESLTRTCQNFHLYIFAFDKKSEDILCKLRLKNVTVIGLDDFEDEKLLSIKSSRSKGEYCWTCTSSTIYYCITKFELDHCTYIDADLYFFSNPNVLVDEMQDKSVLITEHRYTSQYDQSETSGIYCVQFITFRNTNDGMKALTWWRDRCIEWCYDRFEDGKFGDQKYLDDWTDRFKGVHVLQNLGGGLAPWNIQQFDIETHPTLHVTEKKTARNFKVIFFHFHAVRFLKDEIVDLGAYRLSASAKKLYWIYLKNIQSVNDKLREFDFRPIVQGYQTKKSIPHFVHKVIRVLLRVHHLYRMNQLTSYGKNT